MATKQWKQDNIEKMREYRRKWYSKNKVRAKKRVIDRKKEIRVWFQKYKSTLKCSRCAEYHTACLDFHHTNPTTKEFAISHIVKRGWSKERMIREIEKCEVLCANCHRKHHSAGR